MRAVVMAGGRGRRLLPYTTVLPKPLMPVGDRPIVDVILHQLVRAGVDAISISVGHLGGLLESWIRTEGDYGVPIEFLFEDEPLGTAGAIAKLADTEETFLALNGDILTTLDLATLGRQHEANDAIATMAVTEREVPIDYGVVHADDAGTVTALDEKPRLRYVVSMGVYAFSPEIASLIEPAERIDFPDLLLRAKANDLRVAAYRHEGYWRDIGNRDDYEAAIREFEADPSRF